MELVLCIYIKACLLAICMVTITFVLCPFPTDTMPSTPYHCKYMNLSMHPQDICTVYLFSVLTGCGVEHFNSDSQML